MHGESPPKEEPIDGSDLAIADARTWRQRTDGTAERSSGLLQVETTLQKTRLHAITSQETKQIGGVRQEDRASSVRRDMKRRTGLAAQA